MKVGGVLLASGFGRRFGENKLLRDVGGMPLIRRAFAVLPPSLFARAAVVSQYPEILDLARGAGYRSIHNDQAEEGIAASVRLGLDAMEDLDGVLFAVCDQPWLRGESVAGLLSAFQASPDHICALSFQGERGNPVVFPRDLFPALSALTGDRGGGAVIRRHPDRLLLVDAVGADELRDVDTPEDLT